MKNLLVAVAILLVIGCSETATETIASFKGQQVTGVTVSTTGRVFANFPRWREGVENSVIEIIDGEPVAYPSKEWNTWEIVQATSNTTFVAVQSVVASKDKLYVVDTRNPLFGGVLAAPVLYVFNLNDDSLEKTFVFPENAYHPNSYINDVRIDEKRQLAYFTDSNQAGLVILNLKSGEAKRVLEGHSSTTSEQNFLTIDGEKWENTVHSDGIAMDLKNDMLYFHALTGYSLYKIPLEVLVNGTEQEIENNVTFVAKTTAPDGMIIDEKGYLYYADLEHHRIMKFDLETKEQATFLEDAEAIQWADTFSIYNNQLYYTNSAIHLAQGDISDIIFSIKKITLK